MRYKKKFNWRSAGQGEEVLGDRGRAEGGTRQRGKEGASVGSQQMRLSGQETAGRGYSVRHTLVNHSLGQQPWALDFQMMKGSWDRSSAGDGHGRPRVETGK